MVLNPAPIQEKTGDNNGLFPQVWIKWFEHLRNILNGRHYWFDYNDTATTGTPISHTGGASNTYLTNDGLGAYSNSYNPFNFNDIWDTSTNAFDFSKLRIGDVVTFRVDLDVDLSVNNQEFDILFDMAIGSGTPYTLNVHHQYYKALGAYNSTKVYEIYIGNEETRDYPAKLRFASDDNANITVNGWFVRVLSV